MVRVIERIQQEIAVLDQAIMATAEEIHSTYSSYLTTLGQAVKQQLILASYYVCTQGYPEKFLQLSFSERQQLQQAIKQLAQQVQTQLAEAAQPEFKSVTEPDSEENELIQETIPASAIDWSNSQASLVPSAMNSEPPPHKTGLKPLIQWQVQLERTIAEQLQTVSRKTNHLLEQAGLLPQKIPEPVLEAAVTSEMGSEPTATHPNILKFLVETATTESLPEKLSLEDLPTLLAHKNPPVQMTVIHLRLAEIEFTDSAVMAWRNKIRSLASRLAALGREYQKKQHERAIAEAEAVWRMSWSDD